MNEQRFENVDSVNGVINKVWSLLDILRGELPTDDYYFVLFLLSVYKDGLLEDILLSSPDEIKRLIESRLREKSIVQPTDYLDIFKTFGNSLESISNSKLVTVLQWMKDIDLQLLKKHFTEVFDSTLYRIAQSRGRLGNSLMQPYQLTRFILKLANLKEDANVFNPFAGVASYAVFLGESQTYLGQEINHQTWALGMLRLMAYEKFDKTAYVNENSIPNWPQQEKFDLIVASPPFNVRMSDMHAKAGGLYKSIEQFILDKGVDLLTQQGKLILILSHGFLFRGGSEQRLRERLVENDLIESVISLPGGLLFDTGIPLVVLVLNRAKDKPGQIQFVDARSCVESVGLREKKLNDVGLISMMRSDDASDFVKFVAVKQIRDFGYNLNVARYFQNEIEGVKLGEILEYVHASRNNSIQNGKLVRIRDLKDNRLDFFLDEKSIETSKLKPHNFRIVDESALLLAVRWKTLKPTLFEYQYESILLSSDILAFTVNKTLVNSQYLVNELRSDYVQAQLESYRLGDVIPYIRRDDLLKIKVKLPSIKEQIAKVQGLDELSNKIRSLLEERNALAHGNSTSRFNEFASLRHTLGRPRQNIMDWTDNLLHFLNSKKSDVTHLNKEFEEFYDIDMISALIEIKRDINFMSEILGKGENGLIMSDYPLQLVPLSDINSLINSITHNGFKFKLRKILIESEKLKERGIECNLILLKSLVDNVLTNADKHGFPKIDNANEVVIELFETEDQLLLEIKNNGIPFLKNFGKEKFISKYSTANPESGSGIGGYDINRIAQYFSDENWELVLEEDPIYPVKFKFQFPIKFLN
ncbi:N-6 DNA methylase [Chitinophaga arvensicola]|uniref:site-specific DNA-methyltransferase (adenine-specific) n=1 Tax=Chitinophaga arvensicola TaxID=29529 RepID=A0A1I0S7K7_9BACT|nr:N-6 DNA methylase [Chitinophaga arvensicola]SEW51623.1 type I restriction enzyme M protein [Chitinophaga arvensicola]